MDMRNAYEGEELCIYIVEPRERWNAGRSQNEEIPLYVLKLELQVKCIC